LQLKSIYNYRGFCTAICVAVFMLLSKGSIAQVQLPTPHIVPLHCRSEDSIIFYDFIRTSDGSYYKLYLTDTVENSAGIANGVPVIEKYNQNFNLLWKVSLPCDTNKSHLTRIVEINSRKLLVIGYAKCVTPYGYSHSNTNNSAWKGVALVLDSSGSILKSVAFAGDVRLNGTVMVNNDKIYLGTGSGGPPELSSLINLGSAVICLDTNLSKLWHVVFNNYNSGSYSWPLHDLAVLPNGHFLSMTNARPIDTTFFGRAPDSLSTNVIFEFDSTGKILWMKRYGCGAVAALGGSPRLKKIFKDKYDPYYYLIGVVLCTNGSCYDTAFPSASTFSREKTWIMKLDTMGNIIWNRVIGVPLDISAKDRFFYINSAQKLNTIEVMNHIAGSDSCSGDSLSELDYWNYTIDSAGSLVNNWRYGSNDRILPSMQTERSSTMQYNATLGKMIYRFYYDYPANGQKLPPSGVCDSLATWVPNSFYGYFDWYPTQLPQQQIKSDIPLIYPNPASTNLTIESPQWPGNVFIYNMQGQLISKHALQSAKQTIKIDGMAKGNYLVQVLAGTLSYALQVHVE
jgi:hypothetical protein